MSERLTDKELEIIIAGMSTESVMSRCAKELREHRRREAAAQAVTNAEWVAAAEELGLLEGKRYSEFWPRRDGHNWRTRACLAEAELQRISEREAAVQALLTAIRETMARHGVPGDIWDAYLEVSK